MMRTASGRWIASLLLFPLLAAPAARAQTTPAPREQDEVVRVSASEIALDVVVRDGRGRVVRDLRAADFEVYEDGARQQLNSFRLVARGGAGAAGETAAGRAGGEATAGGAPPRGPRGIERVGAVALVFDRLSNEGRALARQAALAFLGEMTPDDFVGVFRVDLSLQAVQPFTGDAQLVRQAVERATSAAGTGGADRSGEIAEVAQRQARLESEQAALEAQGGGAGANTQAVSSAMGQVASAQMFAEMTRRSLETFDSLERTQQGYATTNGLLAVVSALSRVPGRKLLVLFSEGLSVPPAVDAPFRSVIGNANRANVSIYSVDAAGLRATSADAETARALNALGQQRIRQAGNPRDPGRPMMLDLERNEDLLRLSPEAGLGQLAEQTGGLLVSNTNDPARRLRATAEDLHTYYALSYTPANQTYDGRFRQISVKVLRPGLEVQARKGYFAVRDEYGSPVLDYEAPALAVLAGGRAADSIPVRAAAFSFPEAGRAGMAAVVVEVPAGAVNFALAEDGKTYRADFSVVALVKDESRRVVRKLSQRYRLAGPAERLEAARRGAVLFYREADLEPGRYTVAAAVHEPATDRAGVASGAVAVPEAAAGPRLASVVVIGRAERVAEGGAQASGPFRFGEMIVYPNLGAPLSKSAVKELALLLTVYASPGSKAAPRLTLEIEQGGRKLAGVPLALPAPDAAGRIQYASTIPTEKLPPGTYQLRVTAEDDRGRATRTETITIRQ